MKTKSSIELLRMTTALPLIIVLLAFAADYRSGNLEQDHADRVAVAYELTAPSASAAISPCF